MRETSIEAYHRLKEENKLGERQSLIFAAIRQKETASDHDIADYLGFSDMNQVRPRRKELLDLGLIEQAGSKLQEQTGMRNTTWRIKHTYDGEIPKAEYASARELETVKKIIKKMNVHQKNVVRSLL